MNFFNSPNDLQWSSTLEPIHRSHTQTFIAEIIDAKGDGNTNDAVMQEWSIRLIGWGTEIYNCRAMTSSAGYNGTGEYAAYKKGDAVIVQAREGQMDDLMIIGAIRLNGDKNKLNDEGKAQKYGEMPTGPSNQPAPANQVSVHPMRMTKLDANTKIHGSNNLVDVYLDPAISTSLEDQQNKQPIPGVIESTNKEGVYTLYAHGGIVNYTDGNLVFVSGGSKENTCTKFLKQAQRHANISGQLTRMGIFQPGNSTDNLLAGLDEDLNELLEDADTPITDEDSIDISDGIQVVDPATGQPIQLWDEIPPLPSERANRPTGSNEEELTEEPIEKDDTLSLNNRAKQHKRLSKLALEQAEECNRRGGSFQQQSNLMTQANGNDFNQGGVLENNASSPEPNQAIGSVAANNYSSRNAGNPKPPIIKANAHPRNYKPNSINRPTKIFLHHTNETIQRTIELFQSPTTIASAHYTVARDGKVYQHVPDNKVAYHVGSANNNSIGIEHVATSTERGLTPAQEASSIALIKYLVDAYNISKSKIAGHRTVSKTLCPSFIWPLETDLRSWVEQKI